MASLVCFLWLVWCGYFGGLFVPRVGGGFLVVWVVGFGVGV